MPNHEQEVARAVNRSWPVLERYFEGTGWAASGTDPAAVLRGMPWADWVQEAGAVVAPLQAATAAAFGAEARTIGGAAAKLAFANSDDVSVAYAKTQGSKLITAISEAQRETVRQMVSEGLRTGNLTVDQLGRRIRQTVGLHPAWAQAVVNFEAQQYAALIREGKTPAVAEATAAKRADIKRKRLLKKRGENIARTEVQTASNLGRYASWDVAISKGFASKDSRKEFSPGPGACEICAPYSGEVVGWDEPFSNGKVMPPFHPSCRCTAILLPPDYNDDELDPGAFDWLDDADVQDRPSFTPSEPGRLGSLLNRPAPRVAPLAMAQAVATMEQAAAMIDRAPVTDATYEETSAVGLYKAGATWSNDLRAGRASEYTMEKVNAVESLIDKQAPFDQPVTLWRGMSSMYLPPLDSLPGMVIRDDGLASTALDREVAELFAGTGGTGALFEIVAPAGTKGLPVNHAMLGDQSIYPEEYRQKPAVLGNESEVILKSGTALRIESVEFDGLHNIIKAVIVNV